MITGPANVPADWNGRGRGDLALTPIDAARLRRARVAGTSIEALTERFGVSKSTIRRYLRPRGRCRECGCEFFNRTEAMDHVWADVAHPAVPR